MQALLRESQVQTKLTISEPGDYLERQADRVADAVLASSGADAVVPASMGRADSLAANLLQRKCKECDQGAERTESLLTDRDDREVLQAKRDSGGAADAARIAPGLAALHGSGAPLPVAARSFFEGRMGHDFSAVRVHTGPSANELAAAAHARAFTHANHVVFRSGEYSPATVGGQHLIAHELAHTIQQGASVPASKSGFAEGVAAALGNAPAGSVQRVCEFTDPPADLTCTAATSSGGSGTPILFGLDSNVLSAAAKATISSIAAAWHSGGQSDSFRLDGFASCDGAAANNWRLSCNRAQTVARELEAPSDLSPGVDNAHIQPLANGETNQFSATVFDPNRRVEITTDAGTPPPGPPCHLAITGPLEVDHYCAAYVPSNAAACGAFPAPNITLNVTGAAAAATLRWSVTRGAARASLVGAVNTASATVKGDAPSIRQGDVTVQVSDGSCTATTFITVREPTDITPVQVAAATPTSISDTITYTVRDQFGNPMNANICVDETITVCANNRPRVVFNFGDAGTDANGQVTDNLAYSNTGGIPATLCIRLNQSLTAGGCGPLVNNTITYLPAGIALTRGGSCAVGDPCP